MTDESLVKSGHPAFEYIYEIIFQGVKNPHIAYDITQRAIEAYEKHNGEG